MKDKNILLTRYGGAIQIFLEEVSASNTASIDYYMIKLLGEAGNLFHIYGNLSKTGQKILKAGEDPICQYIRYHEDEETLTEIPDWIDFCICIQGTENYRFGGTFGVPAQVWFYRLLRNSRKPILYMQYDAYCKLFLPPSVRGEDSAVWGATNEEAWNSNITILHAGKNSEFLRNMSYRDVPVRIKGWEEDIHAHAVKSLELNSLPVLPDDQVRNTIAFVGKHRRYGSRSTELLQLADSLMFDTFTEQEGYALKLYGNWRGLFDREFNKWMIDTYTNEDGTVQPELKPYNEALEVGGIIKGNKEVLRAYNKSKFAILAGNDGYRSLQQYTVRVFEVLAAGTLPIFERSWYEGWKNIFTEETQEFIEHTLCYGSVKEIPTLIHKWETKGYSRSEVISALRQSLLKTLSDEAILARWSETLAEASEFEYKEVSVAEAVSERANDIDAFRKSYFGTTCTDIDFCFDRLRRG